MDIKVICGSQKRNPVSKSSQIIGSGYWQRIDRGLAADRSRIKELSHTENSHPIRCQPLFSNKIVTPSAANHYSQIK
ncbi:hypothetical protein [Planktothricoides raciborskii]|uniref:hypothetical protein n=1 Tax=Planktothricoides raciborskii TaxID=132608 RepID=UPI0016846168|nr:hypothetical protein [Planktothricoides raciborskii]MBD2585012.1 hypothetical protein [Planktothricoides raciborskii FACHB-1261]